MIHQSTGSNDREHACLCVGKRERVGVRECVCVLITHTKGNMNSGSGDWGGWAAHYKHCCRTARHKLSSISNVSG